VPILLLFGTIFKVTPSCIGVISVANENVSTRLKIMLELPDGGQLGSFWTLN
jgi:hypothetical protein